jgi:type IV pilus assembly protein PilX
MYTRRPQPSFPRRANQRGVVLLVALIFLVLLTLLAIGASSGSLLQQRMVSATRSAQLANMSADTALRGAEWRIWSSAAIAGNTFACDGGDINATTGCVKYDPQLTSMYGPTGKVTQFRTGDNAWLSGVGITYTGAGGGGYTNLTGTLGSHSLETASVAQNPQYIIEDMGLVKPPGAGPQCESGVTGCFSGGPGAGLNLHIYRITARATGGTENTVRVVQSTFDAQTGP